MAGLFLELLAIGRGPAVALLAGLFLLLALLGWASHSAEAQAMLRRQAWYRQLEALDARDLRFYGMVCLGFGLCCFAAMLTLEYLLPGTPLHRWLSPWFSFTLALSAVFSVTAGASCLERAAHLDGWR